jgi:hypothetical protein
VDNLYILAILSTQDTGRWQKLVNNYLCSTLDKSLISDLVHKTYFWNNIHQVRSVKRLESQIIQKSKLVTVTYIWGRRRSKLATVTYVWGRRRSKLATVTYVWGMRKSKLATVTYVWGRRKSKLATVTYVWGRRKSKFGHDHLCLRKEKVKIGHDHPCLRKENLSFITNFILKHIHSQSMDFQCHLSWYVLLSVIWGERWLFVLLILVKLLTSCLKLFV